LGRQGEGTGRANHRGNRHVSKIVDRINDGSSYVVHRVRGADIDSNVLTADVQMDGSTIRRSRGNGDRASCRGTGSWLCHGQGPDLGTEVVLEKGLEHESQLGALAEQMIGVHLAADWDRHVFDTSTGSHHDAGEHRAKRLNRVPSHAGINLDPVQRLSHHRRDVRERDGHCFILLFLPGQRRCVALKSEALDYSEGPPPGGPEGVNAWRPSFLVVAAFSSPSIALTISTSPSRIRRRVNASSGHSTS